MTRYALETCLFGLGLALLAGSCFAQQLTDEVFENPFDRLRSETKADVTDSPLESVIQIEERLKAGDAEGIKHLQKQFPAFSIIELLVKEDSDDEMTRLMKERCRVAIVECVCRLEETKQGRAPVSQVLEASRRVASSMLALDPDTATRIAIRDQDLQITKSIERFAKLNLENGTGTYQELYQARYERIESQIRLLEEKKKSEKKPGEPTD